MGDADNRLLVADFYQRKALRRAECAQYREVRKAERALEKARQTYNKVRERAFQANQVTEIVSGVAITFMKKESVYGPGFMISAPAYNCTVEAYTGADGNSGMGMRGRDFRKSIYRDSEIWFGVFWRRKDAYKVGLHWLLTGEQPTVIEKAWYEHLFRRDPKHRWSKAREDAAHAAWLLGDAQDL